MRVKQSEHFSACTLSWTVEQSKIFMIESGKAFGRYSNPHEADKPESISLF
jgi:hypothetical protein